MKTIQRVACLVAIILGVSVPCLSQVAALNGYCDQGGIKVVTQGLNSTNYLDGVIPSCTVTVYLEGTTTLATLYADLVNTPLSNPFTATNLASIHPGYWLAYSATGQTYDVVLSGGIAPNTYANPVTIKVVLPNSSVLTQPVDVGVTYNGAPASSLDLIRHPFPFPVTIPAGCTHSYLIAETAATGSTAFTLSICTAVGACSSFGTAVFAGSGTSATFTCATSTTFSIGQYLKLTAPASPDGTLAKIGGAIYGTRAGGTQ